MKATKTCQMTPSEAADSSLSQKRFLHYISSAGAWRTDGRTDDRLAILKIPPSCTGQHSSQSEVCTMYIYSTYYYAVVAK